MNKFSKNIGVIGQGFVGTAVREKFKHHFNVYTFDIAKGEESRIYAKKEISESQCDLNEVIKSWCKWGRNS